VSRSVKMARANGYCGKTPTDAGGPDVNKLQSGPQTHESVAADVDRDGDIDILTKPWSGDLYLFVENRLKRKTLEAEIKAK
jgi:hypothetical protein